MTEIRRSLAREDVAALVCSTLERHGVEVVLTGGAVVSIYSDNEYESDDLDFVQTGLARKVAPAMEELGFVRQGRHWVHPESAYWVEFPPGPVQVGDEVVKRFSERSSSFGRLRLLGPTECVMDRLAGFYHWNDPQCLDQAVSVARRQPIDLTRVEEWSKGEGRHARFQEFLGRLGETAPGA
jgi:hypothetical protein